MKSKLAASFLFSLSGTRWRNSRSTMPLRSTVNYLNHRRFQISCSFRAEESSSRAVHSSAISDDVFSDLGPPISDCEAKQLKLVTEKRDPFPKIRPCKRESTRRPLSSHKMSIVQERLSAVIKKASMATDPNLHGHDHSPSFTDDTRNISDTKGTLYISIKNIPSTVNLAELVEAISVFGKVSGASFVRTSNKLRCCNIEFEDVDSSRRAILSGKVSVRSQVFPVDPLDTVDLVTIRISNINYQTSDYVIHSICKFAGEFVGLMRTTSKEYVDTFFNVRNHSTCQDIVKKLNNPTVNLNRWSACALTSNSKSSEVPLESEAQSELGFPTMHHTIKLKRKDTNRVLLDDLEYLNASILHMIDVPPASNITDSS